MSRLQNESGANAVEFALVLPVLITLLFGTMYGASLFNTQQTITHAAREAARYGATLPLSEFGDPSPPPESGWFDEVEDRARSVVDVDRPLTSPSPPSVCVRFYAEDGSSTANGAPNCPSPSPAGALQGPRVEVTVDRPARLELGIASVGPITLTASAVARYEPDTEDSP